MDGLSRWLGANDFMPHGHCYFWRADILWLHVVSDAAIALAYYSIPFTLLYFVRQRRDIPFRGVFVMFAVFIFACGTNHVMDIWTTWNPQYALEGAFKAFTALVSVATAAAVVPIVPRALALRSPSELEAANRSLTEATARQTRVEQELQETQARLEALLEQGEAVLWIARSDGAVEHESPLALRRWGAPLKYPAESAQTWLARVHEQDRARLATAFATELPVAGLDETYRVRGPDATWRWIHERASLVTDPRGGPRRILGVSRDVTQERAGRDALARERTHDPLTGLINRATFEHALTDAPAGSAIAYVDLDHLTLVNDQHGYDAGDAALRRTAAVLADAAGSDGQLARVAGGAFALLLPPGADAQARVTAALARLASETAREGGIRIEATAVIKARQAHAPASRVLPALARACRQAKRESRGRVHGFTATEPEAQAATLHAAELRQALTERRVALAWQPIVGPHGAGTGSRSATRFEVLARLITRDGRTLTPTAFLHGARSADLLPAFDREVVRRVIQALIADPERLAGTARCHVNLALRSAADPRVQAFIGEALASAGVPAGKLCFELSETELAAVPALATRAANWAHTLGAAIAIEHCAMGAAALAVLRALPITYLKVDLAGIDDLLADPVQRTFAAHALELARLLRAELIFTGIETAATLRGARELGVPWCQGLAVAPPRLLDPLPDGLTPWE
jgi:diguanylate cyclase (GGDEF)-like protein